MSKEEFIRLVTADQPDAPPYFTYDAILNTRERATLDKSLEEGLQPVELDEVLRTGRQGRADPRRARCRRIRQRPSCRQHQHRTRRAIRHVGRHGSRSRQAHRHHRRAGTRTGGRLAPGPHRFRSRHGISDARHGALWRTDRTWSGRPSAAAFHRGRGAGERGSAVCAGYSGIRASGERSTSRAVSIFRSTICRSASPRSPATAASPSIARAATAHRLPPAFCISTASRNLIEMAGGLAAWDAAGLPVVSETAHPI